MSKAIMGAVLITVGAGILAFATGGVSLVAWEAIITSGWEGGLLGAVLSTGITMEAGAIASALTGNRGMEITTRQPAANRQIIYGQQRVGGVMIYNSTTGGSRDQMNFVIVIAGHEVESIQNLYLDGRQVHWAGTGSGYSVRNGVGFGGIASGGSYTGPDGLQYNFGGTGHSGIYCEARYGDQADGDVIAALTANDPNWAEVAGAYPWLGGCTYVYLKIEYSTSVFPQQPEIKFTVNGKNDIFDPRTSTSGFTSNWALIAGDMISNTEYGIGDPVNQAQLIAAANVCDEQISLAAIPGTTESRYTCNYHYDTSTTPGDALQAIMPGACGGVSHIGGEWYIWPDYWQGPSFAFDETVLTSTVDWKPYRSTRDLINRVNGTYTAPTYPFNIAGNLYDKNGFYNGQQQNNFPFAFQTTNFPQYAADTLHGFASDEYLNEDGGIERPLELALPSVLSVTQAQRVAKLNLEHNRQQGTGTLEMHLAAYGMQPKDVFTLTYAPLGWANKILEVTSVNFRVEDGQDGGAPEIRVSYGVRETEASVYDWNPAPEEKNVYDLPATPQQIPLTPAPPTNMTVTSGANTATQGLDGSIVPRIEVQWDTPQDTKTTQIQIQYQAVGASVWLTSPSVDVSLNLAYIAGVVAGQAYNVRIRSFRSSGAVSDWVEISGYTVSITLPATYGIIPLEPGILIAEAPTSSTANILVPPFVAKVGSASVLCLPAGDYYINGLSQNTLYYVYYVDPTFAGGAIVPIATTNTADFVGKVAYYLIDVVRTPAYVAGSGNLYPAYFNDLGNSTTLNIGYAFDGNPSTGARVTAKTPLTSGAVGTFGQCQWLGFPNTSLSYDTTLYVTAAINTIDNAPCSIAAAINGISTTLVSTTASAASTTYLLTVPRNTNLSAVSVTVTANGAGAVASTTASPVTVLVSEIFIPYVGNTGVPGSDNSYTNPLLYTGLGSNLIPNGNFILEDLTGWSSTAGTYGDGGLLLPESPDGALSATFSVIPGQKYRLTFTGKVNGAGTQNVFHRIDYGPGPYRPNVVVGGSNVYTDFVGGLSIASTLTTYTYDWTAPAGIYFASLAIYQLGTAPLLYVNVSAQAYGAASEWGADVSSLNNVTQLLTNGSFDQGLTGWSTTTAVIDTTVSKFGIQSLKSHGGGASQSALIPLLTNHVYTVTGWVKTDGAVKAGSALGASIGFSDPNQYLKLQKVSGGAWPNLGSVNPAVVLEAVSAVDWTQIGFTFTVSTNCSLVFGLGDCYGSSTGNANAWFDGLILEDTTATAAADTVYVNGVLASSISPIAGLMPIETGADKTLNHVLVTNAAVTYTGSGPTPLRSGSPTAYTLLPYAVIANDPSDVFSINAVFQFYPNNGTDYIITGKPTILGYVDCPSVIGTSPYWGGSQPSTTTYKTFGFGVATYAPHSYVFAGGADSGPLGTVTFSGSITNLSAGSHTLSLIFLSNNGTGGSYPIYLNATLTQVSS